MPIKVHSLSYSTVRQYTEMCPHAVFCDKVDHLPRRGVSANALLGSGIHEGYAVLLRGRLLGQHFSTDVLERVFASRWDQVPEEEILYPANKTREGMFAKAGQLIKLLVEMPPLHGLLAVEKPVRYQLTNDLAVVGVPDIVCRDLEDGSTIVYDLKTSARSFSADDKLNAAYQTYTYSLAFASPIKLRALVLLKKKEPVVETIELDPNSVDVDEWRTKFIMTKRGIESGQRYKVRNWWCKTCAWSWCCRARSDAAEEPEQQRRAA